MVMREEMVDGAGDAHRPCLHTPVRGISALFFASPSLHSSSRALIKVGRGNPLAATHSLGGLLGSASASPCRPSTGKPGAPIRESRKRCRDETDEDEEEEEEEEEERGGGSGVGAAAAAGAPAPPEEPHDAKAAGPAASASAPLSGPFTPPSHARPAPCSPGVGPSPWCGADRALGGCKDPRVLKSSLNFIFPGLGLVVSDPWHERHLQILREIIGRNSRYFERRNAALLGINVIYHHEGRFHVSDDLDLGLHVSGGKRIAADELDLKVPSLGERILTPRTVHDALGTEESAEPVTRGLRLLLREFYGDRAGTKLRDDTFSARAKEMDSPPPAKLKRSTSRPDAPFQRAYFHSENAFLAYLHSHLEILAPLLAVLPPGATIHQVVLKYASLKQICRQCAAVLFRTSEGAGSLKTALEAYIRDFPGKGLSIREAGLSIFAQVSALRPFDPLDSHNRAVQLLKVDEIVSDSSAFAPHVAQLCLAPKGRRAGTGVRRSSGSSVAMVLAAGADD